ncbi:hypothetical protein Bca52824_022841 [Brassica carinata]|uniref:Uncharacterized protein n=1 Tax=Brassica carinata TaxID=52824 RepID=A0A8X7VHF8_BRACI|nr:hypothetical protein Bca52824_022841 [Brassica carinata]
MTILWEEMVFLTNSASGDDETIEMDETSVKSNIAIEKDLIIVIAPLSPSSSSSHQICSNQADTVKMCKLGTLF